MMTLDDKLIQLGNLTGSYIIDLLESSRAKNMEDIGAEFEKKWDIVMEICAQRQARQTTERTDATKLQLQARQTTERTYATKLQLQELSDIIRRIYRGASEQEREKKGLNGTPFVQRMIELFLLLDIDLNLE